MACMSVCSLSTVADTAKDTFAYSFVKQYRVISVVTKDSFFQSCLNQFHQERRSPEANSRSASQDIVSLLRTPLAYYHV